MADSIWFGLGMFIINSGGWFLSMAGLWAIIGFLVGIIYGESLFEKIVMAILAPIMFVLVLSGIVPLLLWLIGFVIGVFGA